MTEAQQNAIDELQQKSLTDIQVETAATWAYRAWAAYRLGMFHDAVEYEHESLEHAALSGNDDVLHAVRSIIAEAKK